MVPSFFLSDHVFSGETAPKIQKWESIFLQYLENYLSYRDKIYTIIFVDFFMFFFHFFLEKKINHNFFWLNFFFRKWSKMNPEPLKNP